MQKQRTNPFIILLIPAIAFQFFSFYHGNSPFLTPDSPSYMYFGEDRPVGYPLFLALVKWLSGSFFAARYIQLALLCLSLGILAFAMFMRSKSLRIAIVLEIMLFANPGLLMLGNSLMSDCPSAACIALFCACVILMQGRQTLCMPLALSAVTALSISIRLINITLFPAAILAIILYRKNIRASLVILFSCMALAYGLTPAVHFLRHDGAMQSNPLARELFQKTLFREWPDNKTAAHYEGALIAKDTRDADAYINNAPDNLKPLLYHPYSSYLRFRVILPEITAKHGFTSYAELDPILMCYALARIKSDPLYFANDAARQFWNLLTYSTFISAATHDALEKYLAAHPPVLPETVTRHDKDYSLRAKALAETGVNSSVFTSIDDTIKPPQARPQMPVFALAGFQLFAAFVMAVGIMALIGKRSKNDSLLPLAIIGIAFYLETGGTAVTEIALPRYIFPLWPMMCVAVILAYAKWINNANH